MTITLKIGLFIGTCILYVLAARLMRGLIPTWPEGGQLVAISLAALIAGIWVNQLGFERKRWYITWGVLMPVALAVAWMWP